MTIWQRELLTRLAKMRKLVEHTDGKGREELKTKITELQTHIRRLGERESLVISNPKGK